MARYRIGDAELDAQMPDAETVVIDGRRMRLAVMSEGGGQVEFTLDGKYHRVRYASASSSSLDMLVDGVPVAVGLSPGLDAVVYKNAGGVNWVFLLHLHKVDGRKEALILGSPIKKP